MPIQPKFIRATTTLIFDEVSEIRSRISEFDKLLENHFNTPGISYAVGDNVPPSVPRLNYRSKASHTSLDISSVSAQMLTHFDGDFSKDIKAIKNYCLEREQLLESDIARLGAKIRYVGFSLIAQISIADKSTPVKALTSSFFNKNILMGKSNPHEIAFKVTFIEKDRYFINFHSNNYKSYTLLLDPNHLGPIRIVNPSMKDFTEADSGIEIMFDCNNKYVFDYSNKDGHLLGDFKNILDLAEEYYSTLISGGYLNV